MGIATLVFDADSEAVMAGRVPAIHAPLGRAVPVSVDARHKAGHDVAEQGGAPLWPIGLDKPIVKVIPVGVCREDQAHLPASRPVFHVALALNCSANVVVGFSVYQTLQAILLGEAIGHSFAMLPNPTSEIAGDAGIKRAVRSVCYNVDPGSFHRTNWRAVGKLWLEFVDGRHKAGHDDKIKILCGYV